MRTSSSSSAAIVAVCLLVTLVAFTTAEARVSPVASLKARVEHESLAEVSSSSSSSSSSAPGPMQYAPWFLTDMKKGATMPVALGGKKLTTLQTSALQQVWTTYVNCVKKCFEARVAKPAPIGKWNTFRGFPTSKFMGCGQYLLNTMVAACKTAHGDGTPKMFTCTDEVGVWNTALTKSDPNRLKVSGC